MRVRVLTTSDASTWNGYLARLPGADIYHTPEYHAAHQANGDGTALCFVAEEGENLLLHPFMLRDIPGTDWRDIESVYGYSGPLATERLVPWTPGHPLIPCLMEWVAFREWAMQNCVVAEFIRFNPISENDWLIPAEWDRETVLLNLTEGMALWDGYSPTARNKIRKAEAAGLVGGQSRDCLGDFWHLYDATMDRNAAADYYHFSEEYRRVIEDALGRWVRLFVVHDYHKIAAATLILLHGDRMHYHLTGSDPEYRNSGAGNLLLHTAACWGIEHGYRYLHLGGGRTSDPDDALLRFKASISSERRPWYTGRCIHNQAAYDELCNDWRARHPGQDGGGYFLLWRKE